MANGWLPLQRQPWQLSSRPKRMSFLKSEGRHRRSRKNSLTPSKRRNIEDEEWYHGLRTRDDVAPLLRETGDFLVRASQSGDYYTLVLNVKNGSTIDNLTISVVGDNYTLHYLLVRGKALKFASVGDLIKYYKRKVLERRVPQEAGEQDLDPKHSSGP
ncbi:unnamed protein product [Cylicocyclus nassatus]|uniref:SH2 domain-containing protein n=1 Tax=Cylicocyclus nassatus TaxID=53992 RepID=A0AA36GM80_CYLNA|nr:unnamed protein product [Cylicocyclus nassatus]